MNKPTKQKILNLSKFVFEDNDYNKVVNYINNNKINDLRLLIADRSELLDILNGLETNNEVLSLQLKNCVELEDIIFEYFLNHIH